MPELPEVEITRQGLLPLQGQTVANVIIRTPALRWPVPAEIAKNLPGQHLTKLTRRAKYIVAHFTSGSLILHLGMSGRISLLEQDETPQKHDHFDIRFRNGCILRLRDPRRFGAVLWTENNPDQHPLLRNLGPEPLEAGFNDKTLFAATRNKSAPIKNVIMDSHVVVGVGNIYASESLFRAKIHPKITAGKLSEARCKRLTVEIKSTLQDALQAGGSTLRDFFGADGNPGYFQQEYFVYGRVGESCKICGTSIKSVRLGQRSTFYCPRCQH